MEQENIPEKRNLLYKMILKLSGIDKRITLSEEEINKEISEITKIYLPFFNSFSNIIEKLMREIYKYLQSTIKLEKIENKEIIRDVYETLRGFELQDEDLKEELTKLINLLHEEIQPSEEIQQGRGEVNDRDQILQYILIAFNKIDKKLNKILPERETQQEGDYKTLIHEINDVLNHILLSNFTIDEIEGIISRIKNLNGKLNYKPASFAFALVSRGFKQGRVSIEKFKVIVRSQIRSEIIRATIILTLRNFGAQNLEKIEEKTGIGTEELMKNCIGLLDRKEITISQVAHTNYFDLVKDYPKLYRLIIKHIQVLKSKKDEISVLSKSIMNAVLAIVDGIFDKIMKVGNKSDRIYEEEAENLARVITQFNETFSDYKSEPADKTRQAKVEAVIELYNMYRVKMIHEKEPYLIERSVKEDKQKELANFLITAIKTDYERGLLLSILKERGPLEVRDLAEISGFSKKKIVQNVLKMVKDKLIITKGMKNNYFLYDIPRNLTTIEKNFQEVLRPLISILQSFMKLPKGNILKIEDIPSMSNEIRNISEKFSKLPEKGCNLKLFEEIQIQIKKMDLIVERCIQLERKIPKTRSKFDLTKLAMISLPQIKKEQPIQIGPDYEVGFGNVEWDVNKCLACASCEVICPESAVTLINEWDLPKIFEMTNAQIEDLPENRKKLIHLIKKLAIKTPTSTIMLPENTLGFGAIKYNPLMCIACRKCEDRCPNDALAFHLYWDLANILSILFEEKDHGPYRNSA